MVVRKRNKRGNTESLFTSMVGITLLLLDGLTYFDVGVYGSYHLIIQIARWNVGRSH